MILFRLLAMRWASILARTVPSAISFDGRKVELDLGL